MDALITFIIPTVGRHTLERTIQSLQKLYNPNWKAIIVFDGVQPTITVTDPRIKSIETEKHGFENCAGEVRNIGMKLVDTEWIGFVDDDDIVLPNYIDALIYENQSYPDVIIFRMSYHNLLHNKYNIRIRKQEIITKPAATDLDFKIFEVGISFSIKSKLVLNEGFKFEPSKTEDLYLLDKLRSANKKIILSKAITYVVRPN